MQRLICRNIIRLDETTPATVIHRRRHPISRGSNCCPIADIGASTNTKCYPNSDDVHYCYRPVCGNWALRSGPTSNVYYIYITSASSPYEPWWAHPNPNPNHWAMAHLNKRRSSHRHYIFVLSRSPRRCRLYRAAVRGVVVQLISTHDKASQGS